MSAESARDSSALARARQALAGVAPEPGVAKPDPILVADGVVRRFGGLTAVDVTTWRSSGARSPR